ncbi:flavin reductase family protein [Saccharibacillus endophyticus]|uniref:Flavin reductase n=1 Tax=Saccharibacillus endophyticus TaxID=2060666 RepID=A0ABQ1ZMH3_9BACL|nr:flavin reductase family protein [Saccharibacillus endophyticus]GGH71607.1 flavin reductase [Saccharibacillus endophyticus]
MKKAVEGELTYSYPGMVAVVTSRSGEERNVMASGWHSYIGSGPAFYGISLREAAHSYGLIRESGVFGVHFLPAACSEQIQGTGTLSGRDVDKLSALNLTFDDGEQTGVPILRDAYVAYECRVKDIHAYGDHYWIVGEIVQAYRDDAVFGENGLPDLNKLNLPLYMGRAVYRVLDERAERRSYWPLG